MVFFLEGIGLFIGIKLVLLFCLLCLVWRSGGFLGSCGFLVPANALGSVGYWGFAGGALSEVSLRRFK